jgi:lysophospholipase L1-like esterase
MFFSCPGGIYLNPWRNAAAGDLLSAASQGLSDQTMGGDIKQVGTGSFPPFIIVGPTSKPSVCILGDSIGAGFTGAGQPTVDTNDLDGRMGLVAQSVPVGHGFNNVSSGGQTAFGWVSRSIARAKTLRYCSHAATELGINDTGILGRSHQQLIADLQAIWTLFPVGTKISHTTLLPLSTSTDHFMTTSGQKANGHLPEIQKFNAAVRAGISGMNNGFFETCTPLETSPGSGLWINPESSGLGPFTADGAHPNAAGYAYLLSKLAVDPARFA